MESEPRRESYDPTFLHNLKQLVELIGTLQDYRTKEAATRAAEALRCVLDQPTGGVLPTVRYLVKEFRREKMPERFSTRLGYEAWLKNHILPRWGGYVVTALQARPVEL